MYKTQVKMLNAHYISMAGIAIVFIVLFAPTNANPLLKTNISDTKNLRIVGGQDAKEGQFPYMASVRIGEDHACGGSIIAPNKILTAAHCVYGGLAFPWRVYAGSVFLSPGSGIYRPVTKITLHPGWNLKYNKHDIAILFIEPPLEGPNIAVIDLQTEHVGVDVECNVCGWGETSNGGDYAQRLKWAKLRTISNKECAAENKDDYIDVYDFNVCTSTKEGRGYCIGDGGGPLVVSGKQIGVVSFNFRCGTGIPDVYTRVSPYVKWIHEQN